MCQGFRLVRRAGLTASKIHKRQVSFTAAESRSRGIVDVFLAWRIDVVYAHRTLRNIVLRNTVGLAVRAPYCFSLRWRGIRLFYYTIFVANLEKFRLFFPRASLSSSLRFCDFDPISYIITLLISDSSKVRRLRSYDFYSGKQR